MQIFAPMTYLGKRLGICGMIAALAGFIAGGILCLLAFMHGGLVLSGQEWLYLALLLTIFTWLIILFLLFAFVRVRVKPHILPTLLSVFLVVVLTIVVCAALDLFDWAWIIGPVIGMIIGGLLCRLGRRLLG